MTLSRSEVDRAGERIRKRVRAGEEPLEDDLAVVDELRRVCLPDVAGVEELLDALANVTRTHLPISDLAARSSLEERSLLDVAARLKTMPAIVAKLGRESTRLSQMQDIAGGRIVLPLPELQDLAIQTLADSSGTDAQVVRVTDTRVSGEPHGYRAVHVVLSVGEGLTEIQVRTPLQQIWAQLVEAIDQRHGTDLKHGEGPPDWLRWLVALSAAYNRIESGETVELPPRPRSLPLEPE